MIFKGAGVQHSIYTHIFKMLWLMDISVGTLIAIHAKKKKKDSLGREVLSEEALTWFRHHLNTLKDKPIKSSNVRFYFTDCTDAELYI